MPDSYDLLLAGGTVLDPASGRQERLDVGIRDGRIAAIEPHLAPEGATRVLDVRGRYVTPGLIDFHVHAYWGVNEFGFDVDPICLANGVTTAVDAGSAGPVNFLGFRRFIVEHTRTRLLAFVCLAQHGVMRGPGREFTDLRFSVPEDAARTVDENRDLSVGIKVRLAEDICGDNGREALRLAIQAAEASGTPIMVHIGYTKLSIEEIADTLRPGDIITHCYTPLAPSIVDERGRLRPPVRAAHERGVLFDVGHSNRHLSAEIARACIEQGLPPDIISTDHHAFTGAGTSEGSIVDLPTTLSKFFALGMTLKQVLATATIRPAQAMGWDDRIGRLAVGLEADLAVLELVDRPADLRDSTGAEMRPDQHLKAHATIRAGEVVG